MIVIITWVIMTTTSCHKSSGSGDIGTFYFHLHTNIDTNEVDSGVIYADTFYYRSFSLTVPQFYISGVVLHNVNGTTYKIPNVYILKTLDSEEYVIGNAPIGVYDSVSFYVGIDAATNHSATPSSEPATSALSRSDMWYGSTSKGYMFMKVQGMYSSLIGWSNRSFSYEIGSDANLKQVSMPKRATNATYALTKGGTQYIHIICDYAKLLSCINNFMTADSTDTYTQSPGLADTIANNIPYMFRYEQ